MSNPTTVPRAPRPTADVDVTAIQRKTRLYGIIISVLLLIGIAIVFTQVKNFQFVVIDDGEYVTDNPQIKSGLSWAAIKWCFTHNVAANWHPLTMLSHALDCTVFGQNAGAHHLVNVALHAINTVLLLWLLLTLIRPRGEATTHLWMCALVAALFGWHPLRAESVAWVSERKDVLSAFFFLLTVLAYLRYVRARENKRPVAAIYVLTVVLFALGLLSKPMLVTVPFVLLLIDCWPLNRFKNSKSIAPLVIEKIPLFAASMIVSAVTFLTQKHSGSVVALDNFSLSDRLSNAVVSYARYLSKTFAPVNLCAYYPHEQWQLWQIGGSLVLIAGITAFALSSFRRRPYIFVGWFWFLGMLVPVIGLAQVGFQSMADRYAYLPHIGLFIAVVWGAAELGRKPALVLLTIGAVSSAAVAVRQVSYWRDSVTLFERTLRITTNNVSGEYFMALAYESEGKKEQAVPYFLEAIRGNPDNIKAITHLGRIYAGMGKLDDAKAQFEAALRVDSDLPLTHMNLADVLMRQGKRDEAIDHFITAMQLNPDNPDAHYELSDLLIAKHDIGGAIDHLKMAIRLKPDWPVALNSLAWMLATQKDAQWRNGADAVRYAEQAAALTKRSDPGILDTLAAAYAEAGRFDEAISSEQAAIEIAQNSGQANLVSDFSNHLKLYRAGTPYRE